jgi:hypothetical protein
VAFLGQDLFSVFWYAVPVMSEKSTKVYRNYFGDAEKSRLVLGVRMCYVYSYFFVKIRITSKGTSLAQIGIDKNSSPF